MPKFLVDGAKLECTMGAASGSFKVSSPKVKGCGKPMGNKFDCIPMANIPSFGTCKAIPAPTPPPCVPVTTPWNTSSNVNVRGAPAINESCSCMCALGGKISVSSPGQSKVDNTKAGGAATAAAAAAPSEAEATAATAAATEAASAGEAADASANKEAASATANTGNEEPKEKKQKTLENGNKENVGGGSYKQVRKANQGGEVHHMPPKSVSPLKPKDGPSIHMSREDHLRTGSFGSSRQAKAYRNQSKVLIQNLHTRSALAKDVRDVRSISGSKYNKQMLQMLDYTKNLDLFKK